MDPLRQEIDNYENDRDILLVELTDLEEELGDYIRRLRLFEADFMAAIDGIQQRLHRWERRCVILEAIVLKLEKAQWGAEKLPVAMAPWISDIENEVAPPPTDELDIMQPKELDGSERQEAKRIYRDLARRFHPDLVQGESLQEERREVMVQVNEAYQMGDIDGLRQLRHHPDIRDPAEESPGMQWERLVREIALLNQRIEEAEAQLQEAEESEMAKLMARYGESDDDDRFSELKSIFEGRLSGYRERWTILRQREAQLWLDVDA